MAIKATERARLRKLPTGRTKDVKDMCGSSHGHKREKEALKKSEEIVLNKAETDLSGIFQKQSWF